MRYSMKCPACDYTYAGITWSDEEIDAHPDLTDESRALLKKKVAAVWEVDRPCSVCELEGRPTSIMERDE